MTLTNTNVYLNQAETVCLPSALPSIVLPVPQMERYLLGVFGLQGGGLYIDSGTAMLTNTNVYSNQASTVQWSSSSRKKGGGLFLRIGTATAMTNTNVYSNTADDVCSPSALA